MTRAPEAHRPLLCAWAGAALDGENSGDLQVVVMDSEWALVALIDGLGHGVEARAAAQVAADILTQEALLPLSELMLTCHEGLRGTRGVVMTVARFEVTCDAVEWCGVGNVEGVLLHTDPAAPVPREALITRGGVVGYRLPPLKICNSRVWPGDLLVLASDGLRSGFSDTLQCDAQPEALANDLLARYGKGSDDALVLVARYTGRQ